MKDFRDLEQYFCSQYLARAYHCANRGEWRKAEHELALIETLDPSNPHTCVLRARMSYHQGQYQDALDHLAVSEGRGADHDLISQMREDLFLNDLKRLRRFRCIQAILWGRGALSRSGRRALEEAAVPNERAFMRCDEGAAS